MEKKSRTTIFINKGFQFRYIARNLAVLVIGFAFILFFAKLWGHYQERQGFLFQLPSNEAVMAWAQANNVSPESAEFARQFIVDAKVHTLFDLLWKPLLVILLLNAALLVVVNSISSHRIAGSLHRIKTDLERSLNGEQVESIRTRKNDEFQELVEVINKALLNNKKDA